jgi:hypothetical protein
MVSGKIPPQTHQRHGSNRMSQTTRGLTVLILQLLLVSSLGAKLLRDRATRPHGWLRVQQYDPSLFVRGRYLSLQIKPTADSSLALTQEEKDQERREKQRAQEEIEKENAKPESTYKRTLDSAYWTRSFYRQTSLYVHDGKVVAHKAEDGESCMVSVNEPEQCVFTDSILFFIPDTIPDPSRVPTGSTLWVEVTIPKKGPPRPIRLGVSKGDGPIEPLAIN